AVQFDAVAAVAKGGGAGGVGADEIAADRGGPEAVIHMGEAQPVSGIAGDEIAKRHRLCRACRRGGAAGVDVDAVPGVAQRGRARQVGADECAGERGGRAAAGAAASPVGADAISAVTGNEDAGNGGGTGAADVTEP